MARRGSRPLGTPIPRARTPITWRCAKRRANTVKAELIRLGIPANEIAVMFKGESEPLVSTGDGVREPQNRRVEIVIE
ncbi:MAG: hypothetical protein FJX59_14150 [Alphaproteobacteria bacterium]|nr:hypothetical protein [Alphaproteobacteria bacterium]